MSENESKAIDMLPLYVYDSMNPNNSPWKTMMGYLFCLFVLVVVIFQILNYTKTDLISLKILFTTFLFVMILLFYQTSYYSFPSISPTTIMSKLTIPNEPTIITNQP